MTFQGPSYDLLTRHSRASQAPAVMDLGLDEVAAFNDRVMACREFDDLTPADQALIVLGEEQVSAGLSPTLQDPADWAAGSDWAAEDAALEGGSSDTVAAGEAKELPPYDGDGWVGV